MTFFIACQTAAGTEIYTSAIESREEVNRSLEHMRLHPLFRNEGVRLAGIWRVTPKAAR